MANVLVVAAHPDDEVLGCGATIRRHVLMGDRVSVVFMADGESSRPGSSKKDIELRRIMASDVAELLGTDPPIFLDYPDNKMDTVPLLKIVNDLEGVIKNIQPDTIYTHHTGDLNIDHQITNRAVFTAARPVPVNSVKIIKMFEIPTSTEWSFPGIAEVFLPTCFVDVSETLAIKLKGLEIYRSEMRSFPHARSIENVEALAVVRGTSVGLESAEAFMIGRLIEGS